MHHTKEKGDLAVAKTICDLSEKNYAVYTSFSEHMKFDLIACDKNTGRLFKIQVKYCSNGFVRNKTTWNDKNGTHNYCYQPDDFDFYAIYLADKNIVCYVSITLGGITLTHKKPQTICSYYWYEDFLDLHNYIPNKRTTHPSGVVQLQAKPNKISISQEELTNLLKNHSINQIADKFNCSRAQIERLKSKYQLVQPIASNKISKEELSELIWKEPTTKIAQRFGVSDKSIEKWVKSYQLTKPPRGYWAKLAAKKTN